MKSLHNNIIFQILDVDRDKLLNILNVLELVKNIDN
jgi:hypothetical protein